jgi:hypothetical protein
MKLSASNPTDRSIMNSYISAPGAAPDRGDEPTGYISTGRPAGIPTGYVSDPAQAVLHRTAGSYVASEWVIAA